MPASRPPPCKRPGAAKPARHTALLGLLALAALLPAARQVPGAPSPAKESTMPLYAFCGTGDHLWRWDLEPVDSPAAIQAMFDWMTATYGIRRIYWRGGQGELWDHWFRFGPEKPLQYDWVLWKRHLFRQVHLNRAAVAAAHRRGMEIFLYTGLFESGVPPDIGIVGPYLFEDELCIRHPEWRPLDRWGQRGCPGAVCFAEPEVRRRLVRRYLDILDRFGYDGINFYTYVENCAVRYEDEFGYNPAILAALRRKYPGLDPRRRPLTPEQKRAWAACRGRFLTRFLRELHTALHSGARSKKLSVILDAVDPDQPQPWWGRKLRGVGRIRMEWRTWIEQGLVDELWVQLGPTPAQRATLDRLLRACRNTPVRLTVRTTDPFDPGWKPYIARGVTPVAVITWKRNGIERFTRAPTSAATLTAPDWRLRLQTVADAAAGRLSLPPDRIAGLATDPHLLVRRRVVMALADLGAREYAGVLEGRLFDPESCVRIAAAEGLARIHGPHSAQTLLEAVARDPFFQFKLGAVHALAAMGKDVFHTLAAGLHSPVPAVREVCIRALYCFGRDHAPAVAAPLLLEALRNPRETDAGRYFACEGLVGLRGKLQAPVREKIAETLLALVHGQSSPTVRLEAAWGLGWFYRRLPEKLQNRILDALERGFRGYGAPCSAADAAFGWRVFGNALLQCGRAGHDRLEKLRTGTSDRFLAWYAYLTVHVPQRIFKIIPVSEAQAIREHRKFAPPFPGFRPWRPPAAPAPGRETE